MGWSPFERDLRVCVLSGHSLPRVTARELGMKHPSTGQSSSPLSKVFEQLLNSITYLKRRRKMKRREFYFNYRHHSALDLLILSQNLLAS